MNTAVTLICNPALTALTADLAARAADALAAAGLGGAELQWLATDIACDFIADSERRDYKALEADITRALGGAPVDIIVQSADNRLKRLFIADMDSTMIEQECIDELADYAGKRAEIAAITERAMRGELDFEAALDERVAMLKGLPESVLEETFERNITLTPGARTLVQTMKAQGARTALVSGGFTFFTQRVAAAVGFDFHEANTLVVRDGRLTGEVERPIKGRAAKKEALMRHAAALNIPLADTIAAGDGANDLSMLGAAGAGVAFRAKPAVAAAAGMRVNHADLTALLYIQGLKMADFLGANN